jgi:phosphatidylglycerophosphate synthase
MDFKKIARGPWLWIALALAVLLIGSSLLGGSGFTRVDTQVGLQLIEDGKAKTALQMLGVLCLLIHYPYEVYFFGVYPAVVDFHTVGLVVLGFSVFFSVTSALTYFRAFFGALDAKRRSPAEGPPT